MTGPTGLSPEALLRDEARARKRIVSDLAYTIVLDLTLTDELFGSDTTVTFRCSETSASTFIDLAARSIEKIELNGNAIPASAFTGYRIALNGLKAENALRVVATCEYSHSGAGLHFFRDPIDGKPYLHTQFEAREAHKVFANFDQPDLKATFTFRIIAPSEWSVASNTIPTVASDKDSKTWGFPTTKIMPSYITAIVAGPYHIVRDKHKNIDLGIWCRQSLAQYLDPDEILEVTKQGFDFFEEYFAYPYVWGKYDQLFVPEFNSGAMENAGCVTFHEMMIYRSKVTDAARERRASTILHEMAHMWFGNLVTMDWWDDLWLNESFATYMGTVAQSRATRWRTAWTRFAQDQKLWAMIQDQMPTTHPIVADVPDSESARTNFDGISYAKGASVLKQLVAWVGEEPFVKGMRQYFQDYEYGNAALGDFLGALEKASGRDLTSWAGEWLGTAGVNTFRARFTESGGAYASFVLAQTAAAGQPTIRRHRIAIGLYDLKNGSFVRRKSIELDAVGATTEIPELIGEKIPDLLLLNDEDLAYCKIRLDERSLATLTDHLADLADPLARVLCWAAAIDQLRDAELATRDFVRLVINNIHSETDPGVIAQLLQQASGAIPAYGDPANVDALQRAWATNARKQLLAAEPGSDLQLLWARSFIAAARAPEHIGFVRGLLEGSQAVKGLAIDTDVRWAIVNALAGVGEISDDVIDMELERDPTDAGRRYAASARANRPTPQAKAQAWVAILDKSTPLQTAMSHMAGFQRYDQSDLIAPYADRYFAQLQPMTETRPIEIAIRFASSMYPSVLCNDDLVRKTDAYLAANKDLAAPIRRYLLENKDQMIRAMRARALDVEAGKCKG